ncbi:hypothetical protein D3C85_1783850 [compost metagenome]
MAVAFDELTHAGQRVACFRQPVHRLPDVRHVRPDLQLGMGSRAVCLHHGELRLVQQEFGAARLEQQRRQPVQASRAG